MRPAGSGPASGRPPSPKTAFQTSGVAATPVYDVADLEQADDVSHAEFTDQVAVEEPHYFRAYHAKAHYCRAYHAKAHYCTAHQTCKLEIVFFDMSCCFFV